MIYTFKSKVWKWPGVTPVHFVNVPDKISKDIRNKYGKGMIKISQEVGKSKWNTALFPYKNPKGEFGYLVAIKNQIRKKENIFDGDNVKINFKLI